MIDKILFTEEEVALKLCLAAWDWTQDQAVASLRRLREEFEIRTPRISGRIYWRAQDVAELVFHLITKRCRLRCRNRKLAEQLICRARAEWPQIAARLPHLGYWEKLYGIRCNGGLCSGSAR